MVSLYPCRRHCRSVRRQTEPELLLGDHSNDVERVNRSMVRKNSALRRANTGMCSVRVPERCYHVWTYQPPQWAKLPNLLCIKADCPTCPQLMVYLWWPRSTTSKLLCEKYPKHVSCLVNGNRLQNRQDFLQSINRGSSQSVSEQILRRELHEINIWSRLPCERQLLTAEYKIAQL